MDRRMDGWVTQKLNASGHLNSPHTGCSACCSLHSLDCHTQSHLKCYVVLKKHKSMIAYLILDSKIWDFHIWIIVILIDVFNSWAIKMVCYCIPTTFCLILAVTSVTCHTYVFLFPVCLHGQHGQLTHNSAKNDLYESEYCKTMQCKVHRVSTCISHLDLILFKTFFI